MFLFTTAVDGFLEASSLNPHGCNVLYKLKLNLRVKRPVLMTCNRLWGTSKILPHVLAVSCLKDLGNAP